MMTTLLAAIFSILMCFTIVGVIVTRHSEKKSFNNGYCIVCNNKLRNFDNDSQGGDVDITATNAK